MNVIKITSTVEIKTIGDELRALQQEVCGSIETIQLRDGGVMVVNEQGVRNGMPQNPIASLVAGTMVYGPAIIAGRTAEGFTDAPEQYTELLMIEQG